MEDELKNVVEQRQVVSVLSDMAFKLKKFFARKTMFTDTNIADITDGKAFVIGQLVSVVARGEDGVTVISSLSAIVVGINNYGTGLTTYQLKLFTGNMNTLDDLVNTIVTNDEDRITPSVHAGVIDVIVQKLFGHNDAFDLLDALNIPHIFILEDGAFKSYM